MGDCIGRTLPSLFDDGPYRFKRESLREVQKHAKKHPQTSLGELFSASSMGWFEILARVVASGSGSREGIRDARLHRGAVITPGAIQSQLEGGSPSSWQFMGQLHSTQGSHSLDLVNDLRNVLRGLFGFMDRAVRRASDLDPELAPTGRAWDHSGLVRIFGPSEFITSMVPRLSGGEEVNIRP
jgi:hypothetical protein